MKKAVALILAVVLSVTSVVCVFAAQTTEAEPLTVTFTGTDAVIGDSSIIYYPGNADSVRTLQSDDWNFRWAYVLVCDADGTVVRIAAQLVTHATHPTDPENNPWTRSVDIPADGFAIAFHTGDGSAHPELKAYYGELEALEGTLYNTVRDVTTDWQIVVNDDASGATLYRGPAPAPEPIVTWKALQGDVELHEAHNKIENLANGDRQLDATEWSNNTEFVGFRNINRTDIVVEIDVDFGIAKT